MNGPHDLGGQHGFGPVAPEVDEPYFHAEWEKRALGLTLSSGAFGAWTCTPALLLSTPISMRWFKKVRTADSRRATLRGPKPRRWLSAAKRRTENESSACGEAIPSRAQNSSSARRSRP